MGSTTPVQSAVEQLVAILDSLKIRMIIKIEYACDEVKSALQKSTISSRVKSRLYSPSRKEVFIDKTFGNLKTSLQKIMDA
jgi:hypothetical protein